MGSSKTFQYSHAVNESSETAWALGHSARISIVEHLRDNGGITNYQAMEITKLADATVFQHLKVLQKADLIRELWIENTHFYVLSESATHRIKTLSNLILPE